MRRLLLLAGLAVAATVLAVARNTAASHADAPPPTYFDWSSSATPPVAGRAFTAVLVGHLTWDGASWKLSCSVSVHGRPVAVRLQHFHERQTAGLNRRSCSVYVPRGATGSTLAVTVNASDSKGHTLNATRGWRVRSNAVMTTFSLGDPQPVVSLTKFFSDTPPVAGRAFLPVFVSQDTGGPWTFRCSATVHGHPVVVHRQEFGFRLSVPDIRTCDFHVARQAAGKFIGVTVEATTPDGQTLHATRGWRILGSR